MYLNGAILEESEAKISPFDHGFLYGLGVFETFRTYEGHPFLFYEHWERLLEGLKELNIQLTVTKEEIFEAIQLLINKNQCPNSRVRLNISAGVGEIGLQTKPYLLPNIMIFQSPYEITTAIQSKEAQLLKLRRNSPEGESRLKSHHYLNNILAKREIGHNPQVEGVFLTKEGYVAEGIVSNIFWVKAGRLFTPELRTGILNGITRQFVLKLAKSLQIEVEEGSYPIEHVLEAEEAFFTNSVQEVVPISSFIGVQTNFSSNNVITKEIYKAYQESIIFKSKRA